MPMIKTEISALNVDGWPLPDEYLIEIGRVTSMWSMLEYTLTLFLGKLLAFDVQRDPKPFIVFAHSSFPQKLDTLSTLCEQMAFQYPHLADYKRIVTLLKGAQQTRNRFVHNMVGVDDKTGEATIAIASARGSLKIKMSSIDVLDIRMASLEIHEAMRALYKLVLQRDIPTLAESRAQYRKSDAGAGTNA